MDRKGEEDGVMDLETRGVVGLKQTRIDANWGLVACIRPLAGEGSSGYEPSYVYSERTSVILNH